MNNASAMKCPEQRYRGKLSTPSTALMGTHLQVLKSIKKDVEQPFQEKLKRAKQLIAMYANQPNACVSCSFGKDSMIVTFLALEQNPRIPVVFENTGVEFPETLALRDKIVNSWGINYVELKPQTTFFKVCDMIIKKGLRLDDGRKHSNVCCYHLKEKPFALWRKAVGCTRGFTGITALESRNRMFTACNKGMEYYSSKDGLYKIHPLMFWTGQEVWNFTHDYCLPVNEAYAKYDLNRVGCMWCMSHKGWRQEIQKLNPKMYAFLMKKYRGTPLLESFTAKSL